MGNKIRNTGIDILKCICAVMVICIHTPHPGKDLFEPFARMAVPVFFMISGYYYSIIEEKGRTFQQIRKIGTLTVFGSALYIVGKPILELLKSSSPLQLIREWLLPEEWMNLLVFNKPPYSTHLWYLVALLYVLLIVRAVDRKKLYFLIPVLLCGNLLLGNYAVLLFGVQLPTQYSRNFLFMGMPCFLLGDFIYTRRRAIASPGSSLALLAAGILLTQAEKSLLVWADAFGSRDFYIGTLFMAFGAFPLARCCLRIYDHPAAAKAAWCGRKLSTGVYIIHPIVGTLVNKISEIIGEGLPVLEKLYPYFRVPLVAVVSAVITTLFMHMMEKQKLRKNNTGVASG